MKKPVTQSHPKEILERYRLMDDVYVPARPATAPASPAPVKTKHVARNVMAAMMVATFMVSSVGITYGKLSGTGAFFADTETSTLNQFMANLLNFAATLTSPENPKIFPDNTPIEVTLSVEPEDGSVDTDYRVTIEETGGNPLLCDALQVTAPALQGNPNGSLVDLSAILSTGTSVTLFVTLPAPVNGVAVDDECNFDVVFRGWNSMVPENTGYTDEERVPVTIIDPPIEEPLGLVLGDSTAGETTPAEEPPAAEEPADEVPTDEPALEEPPTEDLVAVPEPIEEEPPADVPPEITQDS